MITRKVDSILEARKRDRKKKETENMVEILLQLEGKPKQLREILVL